MDFKFFDSTRKYVYTELVYFLEKALDVVVVGAGIVGLATAYQLLKADPSLQVAVFEKENGPGQHQTGRNSGVIHSGIYYKPGSLKAQNCLSGKKELQDFCKNFGIATQKVGKVIVAGNAHEIPLLKDIELRGLANGVALQRIDSVQLREIEPFAIGKEALWIPECSIVSYLEVARQLVEEIKKLGGTFYFSEKAESFTDLGKKIRIKNSKRECDAKVLVNCAGLHSDRVAREALGKDSVSHQIFPFRGEYYELKEEKRALVKGLIYPVKDPRFPFLGVHLTKMVDGCVEAGPNAVLAFAREGYKKSQFDWKDCWEVAKYPGFWKMASEHWKMGLYETMRSLSKKLFLRDLQKLVPAIQEKDLIPGNRGIRAQVVTREGKLLDDFSILDEKNMVHVLNAPSPAATASFAIGRSIADRVRKKLESL